jgi:hypothetical protein
MGFNARPNNSPPEWSSHIGTLALVTVDAFNYTMTSGLALSQLLWKLNKFMTMFNKLKVNILMRLFYWAYKWVY